MRGILSLGAVGLRERDGARLLEQLLQLLVLVAGIVASGRTLSVSVA
jgi:hypothetical protein